MHADITSVPDSKTLYASASASQSQEARTATSRTYRIRTFYDLLFRINHRRQTRGAKSDISTSSNRTIFPRALPPFRHSVHFSHAVSTFLTLPIPSSQVLDYFLFRRIYMSHVCQITSISIDNNMRLAYKTVKAVHMLISTTCSLISDGARSHTEREGREIDALVCT